MGQNQAFQKRYDYAGGNVVIYEGEAIAGVGEGSPYWRIKKLTWVNGKISKEEYASGTTKYDKIWTSRASYSFS